MDVLAQSRRRRLYEPVLVWQWPIRIFHWVFASAITVLFVTGIYITHPISNATGEAGGLSRMATVRTIHFTAAAVFTIAFFWRVAWFFLGNRYARSGFPQLWLPSWWRSFLRQAWNYLRHDYRDVHLGHNALAGLSYVIVPVWVRTGRTLS